MICYIVYTFDEIRSSNAEVYEVRMCTASVDHYWG